MMKPKGIMASTRTAVSQWRTRANGVYAAVDATGIFDLRRIASTIVDLPGLT